MRNLIETLVIQLLRFFHFTGPLRDSLSMIFFGYTSKCKYSPTCSEYTILQIKRHGTITGLEKGLRRFASCR